jgi:thiol-disulfide isomerase/thioredoxin
VKGRRRVIFGHPDAFQQIGASAMRLVAPWAFVLVFAICTSGCGDRGAGHPLKGQKAPNFSASMLDDSSFELAQHLDNKVVILDFWATWCGPCVRSLPIIADVAAGYKDQGVEFFAVNLGDEPAAVREFLEEHKLSVPVVLDRDGRIGNLYKAEAIPQTVIIGPDGVVQVVHVGFSANLKSELSRDLDALLAGKKLAVAGRGVIFAHVAATPNE